MSQVITSTKPDELGTFGRERKLCLYDGTVMVKLEQPVINGADAYYCPVCGWMAFFIKQEGQT